MFSCTTLCIPFSLTNTKKGTFYDEIYIIFVRVKAWFLGGP